MTQFIIKPDEDRNLYVMFNQDVPIAWGSKRDFIRWSKKARYQHFLNIRKDISERLARADKQVTDNKLLKFDWREDTKIGWRGIGTVRRSELKYVIELLDNGVDPDNDFIMVFVEPFGDVTDDEAVDLMAEGAIPGIEVRNGFDGLGKDLVETARVERTINQRVAEGDI